MALRLPLSGNKHTTIINAYAHTMTNPDEVKGKFDNDLETTSFLQHPVRTIRILHECQVWIDKSVPRVTFGHHEARRVMPNCDPRDRFVYPYLTRMMDSFSCSP